MAFDLQDYTSRVAPVRYDDLDFDAFRQQPLSDDALRCLRYMCDVENYTVCYLRDLLATPSHKDPEVTTFLTMWNYEEHWHGEALADVLRAHGIETGEDHVRDVRLRQGVADKVAPLVQSVVANVVGEDFIAVHMTWGAVNEWSTNAGYQRLVEREEHPVLTDLLTRIMRQEARHVAFYATQARDRLARSARARRLTRWALRAKWEPVGSSVMPEADTRHTLGYLLGGERGDSVVSQLDRHVDRLPGLHDLGLVRRAAARWGAQPDAA
jgi:hypothetical protein